jgi:hypothetical protein
VVFPKRIAEEPPKQAEEVKVEEDAVQDVQSSDNIFEKSNKSEKSPSKSE